MARAIAISRARCARKCNVSHPTGSSFACRIKSLINSRARSPSPNVSTTNGKKRAWSAAARSAYFAFFIASTSRNAKRRGGATKIRPSRAALDDPEPQLLPIPAQSPVQTLSTLSPVQTCRTLPTIRHRTPPRPRPAPSRSPRLFRATRRSTHSIDTAPSPSPRLSAWRRWSAEDRPRDPAAVACGYLPGAYTIVRAVFRNENETKTDRQKSE